ncbi:hypothetical protein FEM48_Zijuj08G0192000 [Ziziphus jujuba var. spinosa]|uniref:Uncharacterized protein n=1 Tax=Ziziphus jujuba var. spinosa TaxID=714518 RepID=A0A978V0V8_ZIZJJ|nr:hypothetical protein FEM48_Zijuj08G0192000 [Ziziphus jujuba var. spinosa]
MKPFESVVTDLEDGKLEKGKDKVAHTSGAFQVYNQALLSGFAYCISSCSMILINKFVLSSYNFNAGIFLMLYQNLISVIIVSILSILGVISTEPLTWRLVKVWLPVNLIFVGMLITSMFRYDLGLSEKEILALSLKYINVAMVTVLKNVTNVITALGEMYLFSKHHETKSGGSALCLMSISAISGGRMERLSGDTAAHVTMESLSGGTAALPDIIKGHSDSNSFVKGRSDFSGMSIVICLVVKSFETFSSSILPFPRL